MCERPAGYRDGRYDVMKAGSSTAEDSVSILDVNISYVAKQNMVRLLSLRRQKCKKKEKILFSNEYPPRPWCVWPKNRALHPLPWMS